VIEITPKIKIKDDEIELHFIRAEGPGGQNVNKVASAVQLRFDVSTSPSLSRDVKERLIKLAGRRMTLENILVISSKKYRSQERNRDEAIRRFIELILKALEKPKTRQPTKPTRASQESRLYQKKLRGNLKRERSKTSIKDG
jgi:ribosome-associated protein